MIIWQGWGILTVAIVALVGGPVALVSGKAMEAAGISVGYSVALGLLVAAMVNWFVGRRLNGRPVRELVDPATGERVVLRSSNSLFFVPMQWWSVLIAAAGLVALCALLFGGDAGRTRGDPAAKPAPLAGAR